MTWVIQSKLLDSQQRSAKMQSREGGAGMYGDLVEVSTAHSVFTGLEGVKISAVLSNSVDSFVLTSQGSLKSVSEDTSQDPLQDSLQKRSFGLLQSGRLELDLKALSDDCLEPNEGIFKASLGKSFIAVIDRGERSLSCVGSSEAGELGLGHAKHTFGLRKVLGVKCKRFVDVCCGDGHAMALSEDGSVYSWGKGFQGQLGHGILPKSALNSRPERLVRAVPRLVQALASVKIVKVACGDAFSSALCTNGNVWTWGEGRVGQLGDGFYKNRCVPVNVLGPTTTPPLDDIGLKDTANAVYIREITCGGAHVLALDSAGYIHTWGFNYFGQLGLRDNKSRAKPVQLSDLVKYVSVSAQGHSSAAICGDSKGWHWGQSELGNLNSPTHLRGLENEEIGMICAGKRPIALVPLSIVKVSPEVGSKEGGTTIVLSGSGLWNSGTWKVRFTPEPDPLENVGAESNIAPESEDPEVSSDNNSWSNLEPQLSDATRSQESLPSLVDCRFENGNLVCEMHPHDRYERLLIEVSVDGKDFFQVRPTFEYIPDAKILSFFPQSCCISMGSQDNTPLTFCVRAKNIIHLSTSVLRFTSEYNKSHDIPLMRYLPQGIGATEEVDIEVRIDVRALFRMLSDAAEREYGLIRANVTLSNNMQEFFGGDSQVLQLLSLRLADVSPLIFKLDNGRIQSEMSDLKVVLLGLEKYLHQNSSPLLRFKNGSSLSEEVKATSANTVEGNATELRFHVGGLSLPNWNMPGVRVPVESQVQISVNEGRDWITYEQTVLLYMDILGQPNVDLLYATGGSMQIPLLHKTDLLQPVAKITNCGKSARSVAIEHALASNTLHCKIPPIELYDSDNSGQEEDKLDGEHGGDKAPRGVLKQIALHLALNGRDFAEIVPLRIVSLPVFWGLSATQNEELLLDVEILASALIIRDQVHMRVQLNTGKQEEEQPSASFIVQGIALVENVEDKAKGAGSSNKSKRKEQNTGSKESAETIIKSSFTLESDWSGSRIDVQVSFNGVHFINIDTPDVVAVQKIN